jgi:glycosyltransferase involved in cell wall biosynthesis
VLVLFHEAERLGAGLSVLRVIPELATYGWTASGWLPGDGELVPLARKQLATVYTVTRPIAFSRRGWSESPGLVERARRTPAYLRAVRGALEHTRPHVVHANTLLSLPEAAVARSLGLPVVLQVHELPVDSAKRRVAIRAAAHVADVLVGVSDAASRMLVPRAGRTPVLTVRNGVPRANPQTERRTREFVVGTIGTVARVKGTDLFLRAAARVLDERPEVRFEHVGALNLHRDQGLDAELAALLALMREGGVSMLGTRPADGTLPGWDVFVLTSRSEAFPLVTLEAMAAGVPVIATSVGGVPEQIEHLRNGVLVPPEDHEAVASWIVRLHDDPDLRRRLAEEGRRRVDDEFTLSRQAAGLHRAYLAGLDLRFGPPVVRRRVRSST